MGEPPWSKSEASIYKGDLETREIRDSPRQNLGKEDQNKSPSRLDDQSDHLLPSRAKRRDGTRYR